MGTQERNLWKDSIQSRQRPVWFKGQRWESIRHLFWTRTVIQGCRETGKARSCFEDLLGKLEYGLICLPTATAASLPLSKAVTYQLLQLLWSCSVDVLLDHCQSTNPTPDSPSSSGVAVITHSFFMCSRWICARQECYEYTCFNKAADKSFQSHSEDILYNHPECPNECVVTFPFTGRLDIKLNEWNAKKKTSDTSYRSSTFSCPLVHS